MKKILIIILVICLIGVEIFYVKRNRTVHEQSIGDRVKLDIQTDSITQEETAKVGVETIGTEKAFTLDRSIINAVQETNK